jgi:hypothetical protein
MLLLRQRPSDISLLPVIKEARWSYAPVAEMTERRHSAVAVEARWCYAAVAAVTERYILAVARESMWCYAAFPPQ